MDCVDVAVVGAGPYGLSVAACLDAAGVDAIVFGRPMAAWADAMPEAMFLKSDGFASNLITPRPGGTLGDFTRDRGIPWHPTLTRTTRADFVRYGQDFAGRFVPRHDLSDIVALDRDGDKFVLRTTMGRVVRAGSVVLAVGIAHFGVMPDALAGLPRHLASHSYGHARVDHFAGRDVAVIGGGASAVELAAFLALAGARAHLLVRDAHVAFNSAPMGTQRTLWKRLRHPVSGLGPGMRSWLCCAAPELYRHLPAERRLQFLHRHLGPRTPFEYRDTIERQVTLRTGVKVEGAATRIIDQDEGPTEKVDLVCRTGDGAPGVLAVDHVIAGTGYRPDPRSLSFLSPALMRAVQTDQGYPRLDGRFESSVPGLFWAGLAAAGSFGPVMRFVHGARTAAPVLARALAARHGTRAWGQAA